MHVQVPAVRHRNQLEIPLAAKAKGVGADAADRLREGYCSRANGRARRADIGYRSDEGRESGDSQWRRAAQGDFGTSCEVSWRISQLDPKHCSMIGGVCVHACFDSSGSLARGVHKSCCLHGCTGESRDATQEKSGSGSLDP